MNQNRGSTRGVAGIIRHLKGDAEIPDRFRHNVLAGQIRYIYDAVPGTIFVSVSVFTIIFVLFYKLIPLFQLVTWFVAVLGVYLFHYLIYLQFKKLDIHDTQMHTWTWLIMVGISLEGVVWGYAGVSFFSWDYPEISMLLLLATAGSVAASFNTHSAYLPAYLSFSCLTVFPLAIRLIIEGGSNNVILALFCIFFILALVTDAWTAHRHFRQAIVSRLRVEELNKELDKERQQANKAQEVAEQANIAKSKFLASASHDLRQPLYSLRLFIDVLGQRLPDKEYKSVIDNINSASASLEELFNELLDLSRLDANVIQPEFNHFKLNDLFIRLGNEYAPMAAQKNLLLHVVPTSVRVRSDLVLLERILRNLISNAIRYTSEGRILIGCRRAGRSVTIQVLDTGVGIESEQLKNIFKEYHQLNNPERDRNKGLGLGLAIASGMAKVIGSEIKVRSRPDKGSCFSITIPLSDHTISQYEQFRVLLDDGNISQVSILFIDDEKIIRTAMQQLFEQWQCKYLIAEDVDEAMRLIDAGSFMPDIIISDYRLRNGRTGGEVITVLRDHFNEDIPAIIVTGDTAVDRIQEAHQFGVKILHKPVKSSELKQFITSLLR